MTSIPVLKEIDINLPSGLFQVRDMRTPNPCRDQCLAMLVQLWELEMGPIGDHHDDHPNSVALGFCLNGVAIGAGAFHHGEVIHTMKGTIYQEVIEGLIGIELETLEGDFIVVGI